MPDTESLARERSHNDAKIANEHARAAAQAAILINGGAATAIIAFISKNAQGAASSSTHAIAYALIGYALGAFCGTLMTFFIMRYLQRWSEYWTEIAGGKTWDEVRYLHRKGLIWMRIAHVFFAFSMIFFVVSSCLVSISIISN